MCAWVQGMGAGEAVDVLGVKEPRKSWQMRKRQERAALKEGLAEWQVGILPTLCAMHCVTLSRIVCDGSAMVYCRSCAAAVARASELYPLACCHLRCSLMLSKTCRTHSRLPSQYKHFDCGAGKSLLCGWEMHCSSHH